MFIKTRNNNKNAIPNSPNTIQICNVSTSLRTVYALKYIYDITEKTMYLFVIRVLHRQTIPLHHSDRMAKMFVYRKWKILSEWNSSFSNSNICIRNSSFQCVVVLATFIGTPRAAYLYMFVLFVWQRIASYRVLVRHRNDVCTCRYIGNSRTEQTSSDSRVCVLFHSS